MKRLAVYCVLTVWASAAHMAPAAEPSASMLDSGVVASQVLGRDEPFEIYLPAEYRESGRTYPVLYFFHGMFDHQGTWQERGLQEILDGLIASSEIRPLVIAMPNGGRFSFWCNAVNGGDRVEDFILQEFIPFIEKQYRVQKSRDGRAVSGISMGGFGSLKFAFKHPEMFGSVSAHSAFLLPAPLEQLPPDVLRNRRLRFFYQVFGDPVDMEHWKSNDPFALIDAQKMKGLAIYFDCGEHDRFEFQHGNRRLDQALTKAGIPHTCRITPGGDSHWDQLKMNVIHSLAFHSTNFSRQETSGH